VNDIRTLSKPRGMRMVTLRYELYGTIREDSSSSMELSLARAQQQLKTYAPGTFKFEDIHDLHTKEILVDAAQFAKMLSAKP
jgi:hypothetical protein